MLRLPILLVALFLGPPMMAEATPNHEAEAGSNEVGFDQAAPAPYCKDHHLVLDVKTKWDFRNGFATQLPLFTHRMGELRPSFGRANFGSTGDDFLWVAFENWGKDPLGLVYMVYKMEITIGSPNAFDRQVITQEFTSSCSKPGLPIDYSKRRLLPPIPIKRHFFGFKRGNEPVRVRIWGWQ